MTWTHVLLRSLSNFIARSRPRPSGVTLALLSANGAWLGSGSLCLARAACLGSGTLACVLFRALKRRGIGIAWPWLKREPRCVRFICFIHLSSFRTHKSRYGKL